MLFIHQHEKRDLPILCSQLAYPALDYYTQYDKNYKHIMFNEVTYTNYGDSIIDLARNKSKSTKESVWILLGHMNEMEISKVIENLKERGKIENSYRSNQSAAILYSTQ